MIAANRLPIRHRLGGMLAGTLPEYNGFGSIRPKFIKLADVGGPKNNIAEKPLQMLSSGWLSHGLAAALFLISLSCAKAEMPDAIAAADATLIARVHAEGAQIHECKSDDRGGLTWQFREPIATLLMDGKTIGRHSSGPKWEFDDGSAVTAKVVGRAPGATSKDIPLLKLEVISRRHLGRLSTVALIQRLNTRGGVLEGPCDTPGSLASVPYAADYTFLKKAF